MNIFEGARRIAKLISALIVAGFVLAFFNAYSPPLLVSYIISGANKPLVRVDQCETGNIKFAKEITSKSGELVILNFCFKRPKPDLDDARKIEEARNKGYSDQEIAEYFLAESTDKPLSYEEWVAAGKPKVPFVPEGFVLDKAPPYKLDAFLKSIQIPQADEGYITRLFWIQKLQSAGLYLIWMLASLAGFWLFVWATGWIVRGFKGIPQGKDHLD